ncbi:hypothetical protein [Clostridium baratii]|uniref:hypothetical protein n=1 Tax=Clostridium baratii TaxID=1561 RepID=UPI0029043FA2|nr:hypothetical protein [Clostridium baratii]MDU1053374.1 hypothetical protein [Clostridium baratii]
MKKNEILKCIKNNQPLFYKNEIIELIEIFEDFNMAEVLYKNSERIIVDISLLNDSKNGFNEKGINIFRGRCN